MLKKESRRKTNIPEEKALEREGQASTIIKKEEGRKAILQMKCLERKGAGKHILQKKSKGKRQESNIFVEKAEGRKEEGK